MRTVEEILEDIKQLPKKDVAKVRRGIDLLVYELYRTSMPPAEFETGKLTPPAVTEKFKSLLEQNSQATATLTKSLIKQYIPESDMLKNMPTKCPACHGTDIVFEPGETVVWRCGTCRKIIS